MYNKIQNYIPEPKVIIITINENNLFDWMR